MTNRIRDASLGDVPGYGSRHGPSATYPTYWRRGKPAVRGKPLFFTIRGKPWIWVKRNSRVLAAKNTDVEFGVFIPNGNCIGKTLEVNAVVLCENSVSSVVKKKENNHGEHKGYTEEYGEKNK